MKKSPLSPLSTDIVLLRGRAVLDNDSEITSDLSMTHNLHGEVVRVHVCVCWQKINRHMLTHSPLAELIKLDSLSAVVTCCCCLCCPGVTDSFLFWSRLFESLWGMVLPSAKGDSFLDTEGEIAAYMLGTAKCSWEHWNQNTAFTSLKMPCKVLHHSLSYLYAFLRCPRRHSTDWWRTHNSINKKCFVLLLFKRFSRSSFPNATLWKGPLWKVVVVLKEDLTLFICVHIRRLHITPILIVSFSSSHLSLSKVYPVQLLRIWNRKVEYKAAIG